MLPGAVLAGAVLLVGVLPVAVPSGPAGAEAGEPPVHEETMNAASSTTVAVRGTDDLM